MIFRAATLACGLCGAAGVSQFPEYAQQYQQRLAGAVDALAVVVDDFDASASEAGMTRDLALAEMTGTEFLDNRRGDMERTFDRYARLDDLLTQMRARGPFEQLTLAPRLTDPAIAKAAMAEFKPALPLTLTGLGFAAIGFAIGALLLWGVVRLVRMAFKWRKQPEQQTEIAS